MTKPYGIISDIHLHNWQAFSVMQSDGMNSRLTALLSEITRAAIALRKAGGDTLYVAGDVFHVRGSVAPSVLNPTITLIKKLVGLGIKIRIIAGNHDLEGKHSERLGSAVTALEDVGANVCHSGRWFTDDNVFMIPWFDKLDDLRQAVLDISPNEREVSDLIIHAPLNGVITGLPDHGLSTEEIAQHWGFKRVFAGHHHNHADTGGGVYSIGAIAHHTWSDVGSRAGFLLVGDEVTHVESSLPKFIDVNPNMTEDEVAAIAPGNFLRAKVIDNKMTTVESVREWLVGLGAKGVIIQPVKQAVNQRSTTVTASINAGASLEQSVSEYVDSQFDKSLVVQINLASQKVLARANV